MTDLYRSVWRWHFWAGLIVLPLLAWLGATGALYLYKPEIEAIVYRAWLTRPSAGPALSADVVVARVETASGARVAQLAVPAAPDESWRVALDRGGVRRTAFVDPGTGRILGETREGGAMRVVRDLHSLVITGPVGNAVVEIAAGWTIILVATGFWLWWPRGQAPALALRGSARGRLFWRDLHASTGAILGLVLLFLAATGLPWSVFWGKQLQTVVAANGLGRPRAPAPAPDAHRGHDAALPWSMQAAPGPVAHGVGDVGLARVLAIAADRGLPAPLQLSRPATPGSPYVVSAAATRSEDAHVLYVEPASGRALLDAKAATFGPGARAIEWGIAVHQGQQYGEVNRLLMLAGCLGAVVLAVTAPILWWKRGRRVPPPAALARRGHGLVAIMLALGAAMPLTGATMIGAWILERGMRRRRPA